MTEFLVTTQIRSELSDAENTILSNGICIDLISEVKRYRRNICKDQLNVETTTEKCITCRPSHIAHSPVLYIHEIHLCVHEIRLACLHHRLHHRQTVLTQMVSAIKKIQ